MADNVNTRNYWEQRFSSGDWEAKRGRWQTQSFAKGQIPYIHLNGDFEGTLLDFGCGLGDAMPIYKESYPKAKLIGVDISQAAVDICRERYGSFAAFAQGDFSSVPEADVIITSNVLEHLDDDRTIASGLLSRCRHLYVITPYKEDPLCAEHIRSYDELHFKGVGEYSYKVYPCAGWSQFGINDLWLQVRIKNVARFFLGRRLVRRNMQILFHFEHS
jgi:SAM-dependent methyltransferase